MITADGIRDLYVTPSLGHFVDDFDVDAITADLLAAYPLSEWEYAELQYSHPSGCPDFYEIAQRHDRTQDEST